MPDWTDVNAHDPGVTLTQLFAWLATALAGGIALYAYRRRRDGSRAAVARR